MSNWGKAHINNTNGFGQAARNSGSGYGSVYDKSESGDTNLTGNPPYFAMTIDSTKAGTPSDQFQFTGALGQYDIDAVQDAEVKQQYFGLNNEATIQLPSAGIYQMRVFPVGTNPFNRIEFGNSGDKEKVLSIDSFGTDVIWSSFENAFRSCSNLITSETNPNLSNVNKINNIFNGAVIFNGDISGWDTSSVTNMVSAFLNASAFNQDIGSWDTSNVNDMTNMFRFASSFKQDISAWNIEQVTSMDRMFRNADMNMAGTTANYDNLLIAWSQQNVQPNVDFNAGNSKYDPSATLAGYSVTAGQAKAKLINTDNWDIVDGGTI